MPESWIGYRLTVMRVPQVTWVVNAAGSVCIFLQGLTYRKMHLELAHSSQCSYKVATCSFSFFKGDLFGLKQNHLAYREDSMVATMDDLEVQMCLYL